MKPKSVFVTLLALSLLGLALAVWRVEADNNIYIRSDGSIEPLSAPISRAR